ncbi:hypothetical protein O181_035161 [Austropuccinia psidii MF-1]|uniref:C2H2-type domain-containing protein n=1 Tax=Austropuccinia psidii MF-1 TaxID=1389203 RepID=A0A9Q3H8P9_9BASI|nr:hypothetical protein [Austropuccinia psidii MF-1]
MSFSCTENFEAQLMRVNSTSNFDESVESLIPSFLSNHQDDFSYLESNCNSNEMILPTSDQFMMERLEILSEDFNPSNLIKIKSPLEFDPNNPFPTDSSRSIQEVLKSCPIISHPIDTSITSFSQSSPNLMDNELNLDSNFLQASIGQQEPSSSSSSSSIDNPIHHHHQQQQQIHHPIHQQNQSNPQEHQFKQQEHQFNQQERHFNQQEHQFDQQEHPFNQKEHQFNQQENQFDQQEQLQSIDLDLNLNSIYDLNQNFQLHPSNYLHSSINLINSTFVPSNDQHSFGHHDQFFNQNMQSINPSNQLDQNQFLESNSFINQLPINSFDFHPNTKLSCSTSNSFQFNQSSDPNLSFDSQTDDSLITSISSNGFSSVGFLSQNDHEDWDFKHLENFNHYSNWKHSPGSSKSPIQLFSSGSEPSPTPPQTSSRSSESPTKPFKSKARSSLSSRLFSRSSMNNFDYSKLPTKRSRGRRPIVSPELGLPIPDGRLLIGLQSVPGGQAFDPSLNPNADTVKFCELTKTGKRKKIFICQVKACGKCFKRSEHLKRHVRSIHTNDKPYDCPWPTCFRSFSRHDNLNQHLRVHRLESNGEVLNGLHIGSDGVLRLDLDETPVDPTPLGLKNVALNEPFLFPDGV